MLTDTTAVAAAPTIPARIERGLVWLLLIIALVLSTGLGFITSYAFLGVVVLAAAFLLTRRGVDWRPGPMAWVLIGVYATLQALFLITANDQRDALAAANFIALLLFWPLAVLLARHAATGNAERVAQLALVGVAIGFVSSVVEIFVFNLDRAGHVANNDPIRLANTTVILGFFSAVMMAPYATGAKRWVYLLAGPVLAFATVMLTGTRIAMVAFPIMAFVSIILITRRRWLGIAIAAAVLVVLVIVGIVNPFGDARLALLLSSVTDVIGGQTDADEAVSIRLMLWEAGWKVLQQSPIVGVGWGNMMELVMPQLPESVPRIFTHLHNEALNFAVFGGVVGVALFLVLIAAPLVVALRSPRDSQYAARLHSISILIVAYVVMGLTDTMLSFELHTALYVGFVAIVLHYCRDPASQVSRS